MRSLLPVCAFALPLAAQSIVPLPRGTRNYQVDGSYQGMRMAPWKADLEIRDTTVNGARHIVLQHRYVHDVPPSRFDYSVIMTADARSTVSAEWINGGREPSRCMLSIASDSIRGTVRIGDVLTRDVKLKSLPLSGDAAPDFAIGPAVALPAPRTRRCGTWLKEETIRRA